MREWCYCFCNASVIKSSLRFLNICLFVEQVFFCTGNYCGIFLLLKVSSSLAVSDTLSGMRPSITLCPTASSGEQCCHSFPRGGWGAVLGADVLLSVSLLSAVVLKCNYEMSRKCRVAQ